MPASRHAPEETVEACLYAAHDVLMLVADLFDLQAVAPDDPDQGISPAAASVLTRLCRQQAIDVARLLTHLGPEVVNAPVVPRRRRRRNEPPAADA